MGIQVIASERGYFGQLREQGDTFEVPDDYVFDPKSDWFVPVHPVAKPSAKAKAAAMKAAEAEADAGALA